LVALNATDNRAQSEPFWFVDISLKRSNKLDYLCDRLCENVTSEVEARRNEAKKRSLYMINEHFVLNFNAESASAVVFTQSGDIADVFGAALVTC
jgi:hypothetical protein